MDKRVGNMRNEQTNSNTLVVVGGGGGGTSSSSSGRGSRVPKYSGLDSRNGKLRLYKEGVPET